MAGVGQIQAFSQHVILRIICVVKLLHIVKIVKAKQCFIKFEAYLGVEISGQFAGFDRVTPLLTSAGKMPPFSQHQPTLRLCLEGKTGQMLVFKRQICPA